MKTSTDPRHQKRIEVVKQLFSLSFQNPPQSDTPLFTEVINNLKIIDPAIVKLAPSWPLDKIAKTDLAILRLAVYELLISKAAPPKVIIDEAVELGKEFGGENSASFINGVLGTIIKQKS